MMTATKVADYHGFFLLEANLGGKSEGNMDLKDIADSDLGALLEFFRAAAMQGSSKFMVDLFYIVERESLSRHKTTPIRDYQDKDLVEAIERLKALVDEQRAAGVPDDYPGLHFVLLNLTVAIEEAERRGLIKPVQ